MKNEKINKSSKKKSKNLHQKLYILQNKLISKNYCNRRQIKKFMFKNIKSMDILDAGELNICIQNLENIYEKTLNISKILKNKKKLIDFNDIINRL